MRKAKPPGESLDNMLVHAADYDSSAEFHHSKRSIGNVGIWSIQDYPFLFIEKQRWPF